jgi:acetyl-CoA/propionyl-CoA carboxylase carboxyl transferase subunit
MEKYMSENYDSAKNITRTLSFLNCSNTIINSMAGLFLTKGNYQGVETLVVASNPNPKLGSIGAVECDLIREAFEMASQKNSPLVFLWSTSGARMSEGAQGLCKIAEILRNAIMDRNFMMISIVLGPTAGIGAYLTSLSEFSFFMNGAQLFITGPQLVKAMTGMLESKEQIGGFDVHLQSGIPTIMVRDVIQLESSLEKLFRVIFGGSASLEFSYKDYIGPAIQTKFRRSGELLYGEIKLQQDWGDPAKSELTKLISFLRASASLGVPLVSYIDTRGMRPGSVEESSGALLEGAELIRHMAAYPSFRLAIVTGSSVAAIHLSLSALGFTADHVIQVPDGEISVVTRAFRPLFKIDDPTTKGAAESPGVVNEVVPAHLLGERVYDILASFGN